jgi:deoxycytidine triphosphate deaminase
MTGSAEDNRLRRDPRDEVWEDWQGAVLLKNEIEYYASLDPPLIENFDKEYLKAASYYLRLGSECRVGGKEHNLSEENPTLVIKPHDIAVVSTYEKVNIPGFLIGRWNQRVTSAYEGIVWVGGPQVDPGYSGHLYCPLYNLSNRDVELQFKEPLFTIDFVKTTRFIEDKCSLWRRPPGKTDSLARHDIHNLESALFERFDKIGAKVEDITSEIRRFQQVIFPVLAIIIAAVAVIASLGIFGFYEIPSESKWVSISIGMSGLAFLLAVYALIRIKCYIKKK